MLFRFINKAMWYRTNRKRPLSKVNPYSMARAPWELAGTFSGHEPEELHSRAASVQSSLPLLLGEGWSVEVEIRVLSWPLLSLIHNGSNAIRANSDANAVRWLLYVTYQSGCVALWLCHVNRTSRAWRKTWNVSLCWPPINNFWFWHVWNYLEMRFIYT